jgi:hypothetical protein
VDGLDVVWENIPISGDSWGHVETISRRSWFESVTRNGDDKWSSYGDLFDIG